MIRLAANLSTMFAEVSLRQRFAAAAAAGFRQVELQFPGTLSADEAAALLREAGLALVLFNAPAGDIVAGDRGLAIGDGAAFDRAIDNALDWVRATGCARVHVMAGNRPAGGIDWPALAGRLATAARRLAGEHAMLLLEPLGRRDHPRYALPTIADAAALLERIGEPNVALQFDVYNIVRSNDDPIAAFERYGSLVGHVQIADPDGRHEPDDAVMRDVLALIDASGYDGFVGCEYVPCGATVAGLGWARRYGIG